MDSALKDEPILVATEDGCHAIVEWADGEWLALVNGCYATWLDGSVIRRWIIDPVAWKPLEEPPHKVEPTPTPTTREAGQ